MLPEIISANYQVETIFCIEFFLIKIFVSFVKLLIQSRQV